MSTDTMREYVRQALLRHAERDGWDALRTVGGLAEGINPAGPSELALRACLSAGGSPEQAGPAAASLYCLHTAVHLVDDIIDGEERPLLPLSPGLRANFSLALQSLAIELLTEAPPALQPALMRAVAAAGWDTARGQELDAGGAADEEAYWRIVEAKTPPLFTAALFTGALLGGASPEAAHALSAAGTPMGVLVQLGDDLGDVMAPELHPDWSRPGDNIVLRFAAEADHPERERFRALVERITEEGAHDEAADILVRCGAMSFCVHHMLAAAAHARELVLGAGLADPAPVLELLDRLAAPATETLAELGADACTLLPEAAAL
ncbi:MAG TPA: polyprenyl synthetase family protein [Longimicrobiaceae bacterium]|nr:polyprenyl synthetase family protein [Longimicrobiaceae bacterium]